jgi:hypothetical protein
MTTPARGWTITGLLATAAGLVAQQTAGVPMPVVPPGLVLIVAATVLLIVTPWRWPPILAVLVGIADTTVVLSDAGALSDTGTLDVLGASWLRLSGAAVSLIAGVITLWHEYRKNQTHEPHRGN